MTAALTWHRLGRCRCRRRRLRVLEIGPARLLPPRPVEDLLPQVGIRGTVLLLERRRRGQVAVVPLLHDRVLVADRRHEFRGGFATAIVVIIIVTIIIPSGTNTGSSSSCSGSCISSRRHGDDY